MCASVHSADSTRCRWCRRSPTPMPVGRYKLMFFDDAFGEATLAILAGKYTIPTPHKYSAGLLKLVARMLDPSPDTRCAPAFKMGVSCCHSLRGIGVFAATLFGGLGRACTFAPCKWVVHESMGGSIQVRACNAMPVAGADARPRKHAWRHSQGVPTRILLGRRNG